MAPLTAYCILSIFASSFFYYSSIVHVRCWICAERTSHISKIIMNHSTAWLNIASLSSLFNKLAHRLVLVVLFSVNSIFSFHICSLLHIHSFSQPIIILFNWLWFWVWSSQTNIGEWSMVNFQLLSNTWTTIRWSINVSFRKMSKVGRHSFTHSPHSVIRF